MGGGGKRTREILLSRGIFGPLQKRASALALSSGFLYRKNRALDSPEGGGKRTVGGGVCKTLVWEGAVIS